jgi:ATP adenylyltransferase
VTEAAAGSTGCIFCDAADRRDDPLVAFDGAHAFVMLNKYPYNNGHVMVVTRRHVGTLTGLTPPERDEVMALTARCEGALTRLYQPHGFNVGLNLGKPAGAGVLDHLHVHVVPRWNGDTNFMSVVGETRVLPEELPATAARLREALRDG